MRCLKPPPALRHVALSDRCNMGVVIMQVCGWPLLSTSRPIVSVNTVAHKTIPMFCCFGQMDLVWSDDISEGSEIYVKQTTPSWLYKALNVV